MVRKHIPFIAATMCIFFFRNLQKTCLAGSVALFKHVVNYMVQGKIFRGNEWNLIALRTLINYFFVQQIFSPRKYAKYMRAKYRNE